MDEFEKEINYYIKNDIPLFYNSDGNEYAYKLFVRHISYAPALGFGSIRNGKLIVEKDIRIVDFNEKIIDIYMSRTEIEIFKLTEITD